MNNIKEIDDKLQDAKRSYEYIKLLDKWLDKKVKPNKNFYKNMKIYDELKRSVNVIQNKGHTDTQ